MFARLLNLSWILVSIRDSKGMSELTLIQLIFPNKVGYIRGSLEIPWLSLVSILFRRPKLATSRLLTVGDSSSAVIGCCLITWPEHWPLIGRLASWLYLRGSHPWPGASPRYPELRTAAAWSARWHCTQGKLLQPGGLFRAKNKQFSNSLAVVFGP